MRITFDPGARADIDDIFAWISSRQRALAARRDLGASGGIMGRPGLDEGTRELIEYPYIIVYEVFESRAEMWCGPRTRPRARRIASPPTRRSA